MKIQYKTEGRVQIDCKDRISDTIVLTWVKGDSKIILHSGGSHIEISKNQLLALADQAVTIADDIYPDMGSLPRPV